jgi:hypothetical protein
MHYQLLRFDASGFSTGTMVLIMVHSWRLRLVSVDHLIPIEATHSHTKVFVIVSLYIPELPGAQTTYRLAPIVFFHRRIRRRQSVGCVDAGESLAVISESMPRYQWLTAILTAAYGIVQPMVPIGAVSDRNRRLAGWVC